MDELQHDDLPAVRRAGGFAKSLEDAQPGQLMIVDGSGEVKGRFSAPMMLAAAKVVGVMCLPGAAILVLAPWLGPVAPVLAIAAFVGASVWLRRAGALARAHRLLARDDLAGAEAAARDVLRGRSTTSALRGNAWYVVGCAAWLQGKLAEALTATRAALAELGDRPPRDFLPILELARLNEVQLVALGGDVAAAERLRAAIPDGQGQTGDMIRMMRLDCELVLAFERGDHLRFTSDLDDATRAVLRTNQFGSTLVLLAWVHHERGDAAMCSTVLEVAADRLAVAHLPQAHPRLAAWLAARGSG